MTASRILVGDVREQLASLPAESVHCVVTSPPYWGLRDYGVDGQIGLEETPQEWVEVLVDVFEHVRRVLRPDGTLWLNVGDAYVTATSGGIGETSAFKDRPRNPHVEHRKAAGAQKAGPVRGLKRKDRLGLPHMLVFALRAAGWYWRDEIVWHKRAPMPESTRDRTTQAHEFVFLLSRSSRYFYDQEAVREPVTGNAHPRGDGRTPRGWDTGPGRHDKKRGRYRPGDPKGFDAAVRDLVSMRNRRSVWPLGPEPFGGAHFATFPTKLVEPCIAAGTSQHGVCSACGAPWRRLVEKGEADLDRQRACGGDRNGAYNGAATKDYAAGRAQDPSATKARILEGMRERVTVGWEPTCECGAGDPESATVLDPFFGAGTTGLVAQRMGRRFLGIELNNEYAEMARDRIHSDAPLFSEVEIEPRAAAGRTT